LPSLSKNAVISTSLQLIMYSSGHLTCR